MRERMREIIRAELDRIHPTDDAYRALELIIESSVRPSEADGALNETIRAKIEPSPVACRVMACARSESVPKPTPTADITHALPDIPE